MSSRSDNSTYTKVPLKLMHYVGFNISSSCWLGSVTQATKNVLTDKSGERHILDVQPCMLWDTAIGCLYADTLWWWGALS